MPKRKVLKNRNNEQEQQPEQQEQQHVEEEQQQEQQSMLLLKSKKLLMPNANPPTVVHTPDKKDNIEWTLLATFPDYEEMDKFRAEKQCKFTASSDGTLSQIRHYCNRRYQDDCKFMLLAIKTTTNQYHVYTHGDHTCKKTGKILLGLWIHIHEKVPNHENFKIRLKTVKTCIFHVLHF
jgi:hypothetical protein